MERRARVSVYGGRGITPETTENINQVNFTGDVAGFRVWREYKYRESASSSRAYRPRIASNRELNVPYRGEYFGGAPRTEA